MNVRSDEMFVVRSLNSRSRMSIVSLTHITRKFSKSHSNITRTSQVHESVCSCFSCVSSNLKVHCTLCLERRAMLLSMRRNSMRRKDRHRHLVVRAVIVTEDRTQNLLRVWTFHHLTRTRWMRFEDVKRFVVRVTKMQRRRLQFHLHPQLNRETRHEIR